ncbi:MAG TPA: DUF2341 domain-containing protein, partial [Chryseolinea sp.]|nr:DUF2341 domain-containing protein [Chryseolinea sp.]
MGALLNIPLSVYPGTKAKASFVKLTFSLICLLFLTNNEAFAQPAGYLYRVKITIAPPSGCGSGNLNDFPILIENTAPVLRSVANGGVVNNANGYDVVFTAANGITLLDFQLDHYNAATGNYAAWVRMTNISLSGTTDIYMYYGNPAVATNQSTTNTWNTSYKTVYHFQSDSFLDGTVNAVNGTNTGTIDAATAKIGGGRSFNGTTDYIQSSTSTVLKTANNLTISTWFRANSTNPGHMLYQGQPVGSDGQNGWGDGDASTNGQEVHISTGTCCGATGGYVSAFLGHTDEQQNANVLIGQEVFTNTTSWHFLAATMSNINSGGTPTLNMYLDGVLVDTNTGTAATLPRNNMNDFFTIGRPFANQRFFNGELDEVRIADTDRGLNWICAEYNNQNNPGSWLTFTNVAPVLGSMESPDLNFTEDGAPIIITASTAITDENDGYMNGATIQIIANFTSTEDLLAFTNANGITGAWNAGTGMLTLSGMATAANYQTALRSVTYQNTNTANPSIAVRTVTFSVTDENGASSNTVSRNIGITPVNDAPVLANTEATALAYAEGQIATIVTPLTSVTDVDNTTLTGATVRISAGYLNTEDVLAFTNTPNITGTWTAATGILTLTGTTTVANYQSAIQSITYLNTNNTTPSTTLRTVSFQVTDGAASSNIATRNINVTAVNDAPVAVNDAYSTSEDTPLTVAVANRVLLNDTDVEGNTLTAVLDVGPANGTLTLNTNGTFTYTPAANFNGSDNFTYHANDGAANSNIVTVTITVSPVNDAPVALNNTYTTNEDSPLTVVLANGVLTNDTDVDANPLTAALVTGPAQGTLTLNANGTFTYTPTANYNGSDSFTYSANDGTVNSNVATVTITINAINDLPVAVDNAYATNEDTPLTVALANSVLVNDTDVEGSALTAVLDAGPANGTLTLSANGAFTYTPAANYNGSDTFTYHANDGTGNSNIATVTITVSPVNDAPVAVNDAYATNEDTPLTV